MNREIKFRAWHPKFGEMVYSNMDNEYKDKREWYPICFEIGFSHYPHSIMDDETILMQYTGLKDKNGKEIYEGDVVNILIENEIYVKNKNRTVIFYEGSFGYIANDKRFMPLSNIDYMILQMEIIGNIYENKDLISKK